MRKDSAWADQTRWTIRVPYLMTRGRSRNSQRWPSIPRQDGYSPFPRNNAPLDERRRSERSEPFPRLPTRPIRTIGGRKSIGISTRAGPIVSFLRGCIEPWLGSSSWIQGRWGWSGRRAALPAVTPLGGGHPRGCPPGSRPGPQWSSPRQSGPPPPPSIARRPCACRGMWRGRRSAPRSQRASRSRRVAERTRTRGPAGLKTLSPLAANSTTGNLPGPGHWRAAVARPRARSSSRGRPWVWCPRKVGALRFASV